MNSGQFSKLKFGRDFEAEFWSIFWTVKEAKNPDGEENVSTAYDIRLVDEHVGMAKGISKVRSQCTAFLQLHGFGHKDKKKNMVKETALQVGQYH